jgi:hypothetical protein
MEVMFTSRPAPGATNEDLVLTGNGFAVVLDGATRSAKTTGCVHDVPWLVRRLGGHLWRLLAAEDGQPLSALLAAAIADLRRDHESTCDLDHPNSPSSTVAILRRRGPLLECLSLADTAVVIERHDGTTSLVLDHRTAVLATATVDDLPRLRNRDDGFWVASTRPEAAFRAATATFDLADVRCAGLVSDGVTRLVDRYGWSWPKVLHELAQSGPDAVVDAVRLAESAAGPHSAFPGKKHDDASAVVCRFAPHDFV